IPGKQVMYSHRFTADEHRVDANTLQLGPAATDRALFESLDATAVALSQGTTDIGQCRWLASPGAVVLLADTEPAVGLLNNMVKTRLLLLRHAAYCPCQTANFPLYLCAHAHLAEVSRLNHQGVDTK